MFSLARTPITAKQALIASFPFPATTTTATAPLTDSSTTPRRPRRFTGVLFTSPGRPSSPRIFTMQGMHASSAGVPNETKSPLLRQAYSTAFQMSPRESTTFTPPSPTFAVAPSSPRMPIKSCLKSPVGPRSPVANIHSPRFASVGMISIRSREGPLWNGDIAFEDVPLSPVLDMKSPRFTSSAMTPVKSREGPLWGVEGKMRKMGLKQDYGSDGAGDAVAWKKCRTRVPTPFQSPRMEWLDSAGGQSDQHVHDE